MSEGAVVRRLLEDQILRLWGRGETGLVHANYAPDVVDHMPMPGQPPGLDALADVVMAFRRALHDMRMTLHGTLVSGPFGLDFWTLTGIHAGPLFGRPPTGRAVRFSGIDMIRVEQGRIAELWHVEEMLQFEDQLGDEPAAFGRPAGLVTAVPEPPRGSGVAAWAPDPATLTPRERRNLAIARRHIEEIWAGGDVTLAHTLYAPEVVDMNPASGQRPGVDGILDVLLWLREAVPDLRMEIGAYLVEGDLVADRWTMTGTHTGAPLMGIDPAGRRFTMHGMDVIRIRDDGLIDRVWHAEELARMRRQIAA